MESRGMEFALEPVLKLTEPGGAVVGSRAKSAARAFV